jgi:hypothetical protein
VNGHKLKPFVENFGDTAEKEVKLVDPIYLHGCMTRRKTIKKVASGRQPNVETFHIKKKKFYLIF